MAPFLHGLRPSKTTKSIRGILGPALEHTCPTGRVLEYDAQMETSLLFAEEMDHPCWSCSRRGDWRPRRRAFGLPLVCMSHCFGSVKSSLCKTFIKDTSSPVCSADGTCETISR